jgi:hypothetical protein
MDHSQIVEHEQAALRFLKMKLSGHRPKETEEELSDKKLIKLE